jgi:hypothetical protein
MVTEYCACGKPLHYTNPATRMQVERLVATAGPDVTVLGNGRTWLMPRHYIALHGLKTRDLPSLRFPELLSGNQVRIHYKYDSGTTILPMTKPDYYNQRFTHIDEETGEIRHFHIPKLRSLLNNWRVRLMTMAITEEQAELVITTHAVDERHLGNLAIDKPGIICEFPDTTQLLVDGNHRYVKRFRLGLKTMEFWSVPENIWRKCLLNITGVHW